MKRMIEQVKPAVWNRSYSNPGSQGTLIRSTSRWPLPSPMPESFDGLYFGTTIHYPPVHVHRNDSCYVPDGCDISCAYLDRMEEWDRKKYRAFIETITGGHKINGWVTNLLEQACEDDLLKGISQYFEVQCVSARCVYYYNVATGYDCPCIEYIFISKETNDEDQNNG